jgi:hypothetical protein
LVLFPPSPKRGGDQFLGFFNPLAQKQTVRSFEDSVKNSERASKEGYQVHTQAMNRDIEVFASDIIRGHKPCCQAKAAEVVQIVRSYALNAWFDRLQTFREQSQNICFEIPSQRERRRNIMYLSKSRPDTPLSNLLKRERSKAVCFKAYGSIQHLPPSIASH